MFLEIMLRVFRGKKAQQQFDKAIGHALADAKRGDVNRTIRQIKETWAISNKYGLRFTQREATYIRDIAYKRGLENSVTFATSSASQGDVPAAMNFLNCARHYASELGISVDEENIGLIVADAYRNGTEKQLEWASHELEQGLPVQAIRALRTAQNYASRAGLDINQKAGIMEHQIAAKGVELYLKLAREEAERGITQSALELLRRAKKFSRFIGADLTQPAQEIERIAYGNQVSRLKRVAENYRSDGYNNRAMVWEGLAQKTATKAGVTLDHIVK